MIKKTLHKLVKKKNLNQTEAIVIMQKIMNGELTESQIACFLTALKIKKATNKEILGFLKSIRKKAVKINVRAKYLVDTCGTGGDNSHTFNISTAVAFVAAGADVSVAKHGNRSASSRSGSADVLEKLGVNINCNKKKTKENIEKTGIGFMFAPMYHPSFKYVAKVRKELGFKTVFNFLGPLCNPTNVKNQVIGVYDLQLTEKIAEILKLSGSEHVLVVHGSGLDEMTLTGKTKISELKNDIIKTYELSPEKFSFSGCSLNELQGGTPVDNAGIILNILEGKKGPKTDIVLLNAGAAIYASGKADSIHKGIKLAKKSIESGKALEKLKKLRSETNNKNSVRNFQ